MKSRIAMYIFFSILCVVGIALYMVRPDFPFFNVTMSAGAGLIGAIFVAVSLEAINGYEKRRYTLFVQKEILSGARSVLKNFYWVVFKMFLKYDMDIPSPCSLDEETDIGGIFAEIRRHIGENAEIDGQILSKITAKVDDCIDAFDRLNSTIHKNMAVYVAGGILTEGEIVYLSSIHEELREVDASSNMTELLDNLIRLYDLISKSEVLRVQVADILCKQYSTKKSSNI